MNNNEELNRATGERTVEKLEFRMGPFGAAVPLLFFVVWAITISVMQLSSEVALVLGAVMGVTLGLLLCKSKWEDYAQGLFDGLAQPIGVIAMVAWFYAGMFAQILQVGGAGGRARLDRFGDRCRRRTVCRTDLPSRISILNCCRYRIWNNRCILYADVSGRCCSGGRSDILVRRHSGGRSIR